MTKILMVVGSNHANGFQTQLAHKIAHTIADRAEVSFLDYKDVPFMSQDIEFPAPESVTAAREAFTNSDGVWLISPVYNDSYSSLTKNLLDWISRPIVANDRSTCASTGIKITFSCASGGSAYEHMFSKLTDLAKFIGMDVMDDPMLGYSLTSEWATGKLTLTDEAKERMEAQIVAFLNKITQY